jgi:hypothetical protein
VQYVFCYTIVLPSFRVFDDSVSLSLLSIYSCLHTLPDTTWHESNHHPLPLTHHKSTRYSHYLLQYRYTTTQTVQAVGHSAIWRVAWNATGTVLATSSEDGIVALWRKDFLGTWKCVQEVSEVQDGTDTTNHDGMTERATTPLRE